MKNRFAVQQGKQFMEQTEFPDTDSIMDNLYMAMMSNLVDECCEVGEQNAFQQQTYVDKMNRSIHDDTVYGYTEISAMHEKVKEYVWKLFEEKKKGNNKLHERYKENLKKIIDLEREKLKLSNGEKKISSKRDLNEAVDVCIV